MPRLARQLLAEARAENPLLPLILQGCRDIFSARQEIRWLTEFAACRSDELRAAGKSMTREKLLYHLCHKRSSGYPLQYILGSEFFGEIEIACRRGVLIPRQETAAAVSHLLSLFRDGHKKRFPPVLRILDLCTGTGCIALSLAHQFPYAQTSVKKLDILGLDLSKQAVRLACYNRKRLKSKLIQKLRGTTHQFTREQVQIDKSRMESLGLMRFLQADVLPDSVHSSSPVPNILDILQHYQHQNWDILISNPPYISPLAFNRSTSYSVRHFEPRMALVPPEMANPDDGTLGDTFYPRLLELADLVKAKVLLLEIADIAQAVRVAGLVEQSQAWEKVEIWRDQPNITALHDQQPFLRHKIHIFGQGNGRSVFSWRGEGGPWTGH